MWFSVLHPNKTLQNHWASSYRVSRDSSHIWHVKFRSARQGSVTPRASLEQSLQNRNLARSAHIQHRWTVVNTRIFRKLIHIFNMELQMSFNTILNSNQKAKQNLDFYETGVFWLATIHYPLSSFCFQCDHCYVINTFHQAPVQSKAKELTAPQRVNCSSTVPPFLPQAPVCKGLNNCWNQDINLGRFTWKLPFGLFSLSDIRVHLCNGTILL